MIRKIVRIDEEKCDGCGQCAGACAEGAIEIVDGKARLVSDSYCDGLGACLGKCPVDAITVEEREAPEFDETAALKHARKETTSGAEGRFQCPGTMSRQFAREAKFSKADDSAESELANWPIQLKLVSPSAPCFRGADLLVAADCAPFAMRDFHSRILAGKAIVIACPKLDDAHEEYVAKLTELFRTAALKSVTVVHMEVPCCFGIQRMVQAALAASGRDIPLREMTVGIGGEIQGES